MFFSFQNILQDLHYLSICLHWNLYVLYVSGLFLIHSKVLLFFITLFFFCKVFFYFSILYFFAQFFGVISTTLAAAPSTISFCSCLTATAGGCNCTWCKLHVGFDTLHEPLQKPTYVLYYNHLLYENISEKE